MDLLRRGDGLAQADIDLFYSGSIDLLDGPAISIVGTRDVSARGAERAREISRQLVRAGVAIVSGLAKGVDTEAHTAAIDQGGTTIGVIGTPLTKAYPAENGRLQEFIYRHHLLISPFAPDARVFKGNFPARNRVMAAVSDATFIVEASDTSGTLHQAAECQRLGRWLFISKEVIDDPKITWPSRFLGKPKVHPIHAAQEMLAAIGI